MRAQTKNITVVLCLTWIALTPASYGCIRMGSADIIALCQWVKAGARVDVVLGKLPPPDQLPQ